MQRKKLLTIQHASVNPPGLLGDILTKHDLDYDVVHAEGEEMPTDAAGYDATIIFGGLEHVYDELKQPFITREKRLVASVLERKLPFLGICFGCQLLASALGAEVYKCTPSLGFVRIDLTEDGQRDPFYHGFADYQQAFQWHDDDFDLPAGAVLLATAHGRESQAFRWGENAYGVLYHIELTAAMLQNWLEDPDSRKEFIERTGIETYNKTDREYDQLYPAYHDHASKVIENFLRLARLIPA
ncbi:GMP synthase [Dictyobacter sp. S3.2.2.5]|uniref:GMP synthase n=1 Tax=Dictyobacter halimunensis TaxID=3026934 RepID=A0ABQ6FW91_9CHLR|nr:GMP synthase [Dictyobacter sp. S3.2.2.5]